MQQDFRSSNHTFCNVLLLPAHFVLCVIEPLTNRSLWFEQWVLSSSSLFNDNEGGPTH